MPDMALIAQTVSTLKSAFDFSKTLIGLRDAAMINEKVIELQRIILSAQSEAMAAQTDQVALLEAKRQLEKQIAQMEAWETEKQRYELKSGYFGGAFVYALKPEARVSEPPHWICATCYQAHKKSILQRGAEPKGGNWPWQCPNCKTTAWAKFEGPKDPNPTP